MLQFFFFFFFSLLLLFFGLVMVGFLWFMLEHVD